MKKRIAWIVFYLIAAECAGVSVILRVQKEGPWQFGVVFFTFLYAYNMHSVFKSVGRYYEEKRNERSRAK